MSRLSAVCLLSVFTGFLSACGGGGGSPSGPTPVPTPVPVPTPPGPRPSKVLIFFDGLNFAKSAANANVIVDGVQYFTDSGGRITLEKDITPHAIVEVLAEGFLNRKTMPGFDVVFYGQDPDGAYRFGLWPLAFPQKGKVFEQLVAFPTGRLLRPEKGQYTFAFSGSILSLDAKSKDRVMKNIRDSLLVTEIMSKGDMTFTEINDYENAKLKFEINPDDSNLPGNNALFYPDITRYTITGGRIVFRNVEIATGNTALHEIGHFLGFGHSSEDDVMNPSRRDKTKLVFSGNLVNLFFMMRHRIAGTIFEDNGFINEAPVGVSINEAIHNENPLFACR